VEGIAEPGALHALQEAFEVTGGAQCGFCTPGILMSSIALLEGNAEPSLDEIREALSGNLCRCTGYAAIYEAVELAAVSLRRDGGIGIGMGLPAGLRDGDGGGRGSGERDPDGGGRGSGERDLDGGGRDADGGSARVPAVERGVRANRVPPGHDQPVVPAEKVTED
jgi:hypothetical protein